MSSELNLCPFCGGEARFEIDTDGSFMLEVEHEPWCFLTSMDTRHWYYCETVEEAAQDWNQRAEPAYLAGYKDGYQMGKSEVRTCKVKWKHIGGDVAAGYCECGAELDRCHDYEPAHLPNFCPKCGVKVVE